MAVVLTLVASALLAAPATPKLPDWQATASRSTLTFAGVSQGAGFTGRFKAFTADVRFDPGRLGESSITVTIPLASADTANAERDATLQGKDFFDTAGHPAATWKAVRFRALGGNRYAADGALTLRGITRPVSLDFTWTAGAAPRLVGEARVNRLDFQVGGGEWADTSVIANAVKVHTALTLAPAR